MGQFVESHVSKTAKREAPTLPLSLLRLHEGYVDLGADGDFLTVDGEGLVFPLADGVGRGFREL